MNSNPPHLLLLSMAALLILSACELSLAQDITPPPNYQRVSLERPPAQDVFVLPDNSPSLGAGAAIFAQSCAPCHGGSGLGGGPQAAILPAEPPLIGSAELASQASPVEWFAMITLGNIANLMPPFEDSLSVQERWDVLSYVYSLSDSEEALAAALPQGMQIIGLSGPEPTELAAPTGAEQPPAAPDDDLPDLDEETQELGTITGAVSHGAGAPLPPDLEVTLLGLDGFELVFSNTVVIQADGGYIFEDVEMVPERIFFTSLDYQGMSYSSRFDVIPEEEITLDFPITIYDTIENNSGLVISTLVIQLEFPDADTTRIHYIYQIANPTSKTVIPPGDDLPTLSYALPQNALNFSFDMQIEGDNFVLTAGGFGDTRAIMAGSEDYVIAFGYDLSYNRELNINLDLTWPVERLVVLLPADGLSMTGENMREEDQAEVAGINSRIYGGGPFQPGLLQLVVVGRNPSAPPGFLGLDIDMNLLVSASVFFVTGVFAVLWFNQVRNFSTEHAPASPEEIMDAIIDLDVRFEAGDLAEDVYQPRRRALKSRLSERIENSD